MTPVEPRLGSPTLAWADKEMPHKLKELAPKVTTAIPPIGRVPLPGLRVIRGSV